MAGKGRCAGCGETGPLKAVRSHIRSCPEFAAAFRRDPDVLGPEQEYARWEQQDKAAERSEEITTHIAEVDAYREDQARRFTRPPDILGEDEPSHGYWEAGDL